MENVLVVGAGFMGAGIAQVCAQSGYRVFLMDTDRDGLKKALGKIKWEKVFTNMIRMGRRGRGTNR